MGGLRHTVVERWAQRPSGYTHRGVVGVAVDSRERAFILTRGEARVIIYERDGSFVGSWGEGRFTERTHGLTIAPDNSVFVVDEGREVVYKFTPDGELLLTLGTPGGASDTGYDGRSLESIARGGPPFHHPTNIAFDRARRVHGVSPDDRPDRVAVLDMAGGVLARWGGPDRCAPGNFIAPHDICCRDDHQRARSVNSVNIVAVHRPQSSQDRSGLRVLYGGMAASAH